MTANGPLQPLSALPLWIDNPAITASELRNRSALPELGRAGPV